MQLCPTTSTLSAEPDGADSGPTGTSLPPPLSGKATLETFIYNSRLLLRKYNFLEGRVKDRAELCYLLPYA